jgi:diguanylate cyclase (GGDEF)-like protein
VRYVHERFPLEIVSILLHDEGRGQFVAAADAGASIAKRGERWSIACGIVGRCLREGKTQIVRDVKSDDEYIRVNANVVAELVVPIRHRDEILGVFNLESRSADIFTPANILAFELFADQISGALRLVRTNEKVEQQARDLQFANEALTGMVEKFHAWSAHDSLTALYNRSHFDKVFPVEWRRAARSRVPLSLILADIDSFKAYNDKHGHLAGDECLRRVAEAIGETMHRAADVVTRYGGEEFAVILPYTDRESAIHMAETIRRRVLSLHIEHPTPASKWMTISIGVATIIPDGDEKKASTLIEAADRALYSAKRTGRNRVVAV